MRVVIYSRVSTQSQDYERQTNELLEHAKKMGYEVLMKFEEKISGGKKNIDRPELEAMLKFVRDNKVQKVLAWELSRIGRDSLEVLKTINLLNEHKVSLFIKNYNLETLNEEGEVNPLTQFMIQILNSVSEMERSTIRLRIKSGYDNYRKHGGKVGRKEGFKKDEHQLLEQYKDVAKLLKQGYSVRKVMKLTDKSSGTVQKVKKLIS